MGLPMVTHLTHMGISIGWNAYLLNCWMDFICSKFYGNVFTCSCAMGQWAKVHISKSALWIYSFRNSMELCKPVVVQNHGRFVIFPIYPSIDQSHRYERHQAACREPAGSYDKTTRTAICFEHKRQYLLIHAPYTCIVVFWHISNIPPMISQSQISCNTPTLYIEAIFVRYCYTTGSWLL